MTIIDRYLLRQFVQTFVICFASLTGVFVVFDAFTNLNAFMDCARGAQLLKLMATFYAFQSIFFFDRTSSLLVLMSAMFTVTWIQRHNEMTALMAAGISRLRVVTPIIAAAITVTLLATVNREVVIPRYKQQLSQRPTDPQGRASLEVASQYDFETSVLIRGRAGFQDGQRIEKPDFLMPRELDAYGPQLVAENAYFQPAAKDRPAGLLFDAVQEPKNLDRKPSLMLNGKPVVITPHDRPDWLKPGQAFLVSDVTFDQITGGMTFRTFSSTAEMIRALRNRSLNFGADIRVAIHSRIVQPLADITLLFLGLPLVVTRESRNVFLAIGLCMGLVGLFFVVGIGFQQLGASGLISPVTAAWAPLLLFVPAAVGLSESMWER